MKKKLISITLAVMAIAMLDNFFPADLEPSRQALVVVDDTGEPLRLFADSNGVWRYPTDITQVSENYIEALLTYEDRWFYSHPGVNPFAMTRAAWQWFFNGEIISGGSTLTMQVARLRYPNTGGMKGKIQQILRAMQLEWHYNKTDILNYYLNHAPFGGVIEGVEAASRSYFGHSAALLTDAQAALLAGLPQAPSFFRPDRYPERAQDQRDKVLKRQEAFKSLTFQERESAELEPVYAITPTRPVISPLLARRLRQQTPDRNIIETYINRDVQQSVEQLARDSKDRLPDGASIAIMVMEHGTGHVIAYVGSADFFDDNRFGHVDMVQAYRSPGSTLKPFIYGMALDEGLVHSESLLMDVPLQFEDYIPQNFMRGFSGPVSLSSALRQSLNVPVVQVLAEVGSTAFYLSSQHAGAGFQLPTGSRPNLAVALGGVSTNLENLVRLYSSLGNNGETLKPRYTPEDAIERNRFLSPGASWIIRDILKNDRRSLAIKTGTSSSYRDHWALGVSDYHTIGVWVGHPDNTAMTGYHGDLVATPLVNAVARRLTPTRHRAPGRPKTVTSEAICWPGGQVSEQFCDQRRQAWVLNDIVPATLMGEAYTGQKRQATTLSYLKAQDSGLRVGLGCVEDSARETIPLWPAPLQNWIPAPWRLSERLPAPDPRCSLDESLLTDTPVSLSGVTDGSHFKTHQSTGSSPELSVRAVGGQPRWFWFLNGQLLDEESERLTMPMPVPGRYQLIVSDQSGQSDQVRFVVEH